MYAAHVTSGVRGRRRDVYVPDDMLVAAAAYAHAPDDVPVAGGWTRTCTNRTRRPGPRRAGHVSARRCADADMPKAGHAEIPEELVCLCVLMKLIFFYFVVHLSLFRYLRCLPFPPRHCLLMFDFEASVETNKVWS